MFLEQWIQIQNIFCWILFALYSAPSAVESHMPLSSINSSLKFRTLFRFLKPHCVAEPGGLSRITLIRAYKNSNQNENFRMCLNIYLSRGTRVTKYIDYPLEKVSKNKKSLSYEIRKGQMAMRSTVTVEKLQHFVHEKWKSLLKTNSFLLQKLHLNIGKKITDFCKNS